MYHYKDTTKRTPNLQKQPKIGLIKISSKHALYQPKMEHQILAKEAQIPVKRILEFVPSSRDPLAAASCLVGRKS